MGDQTEKLTRDMAAGKKEAVEMFYRRYFDWLLAQARLSCRRDEAFCLDVVQDAVIRVMRMIQPVKSEPQLRCWLRLVVKTTAFDHLRSQKRRTSRELVVTRNESLADERQSDQEQLDWLTDQLAQLDPEIVRLIKLRYEQRWTLAKISESLGLSIGTIDGRLRRALKHLSELATKDFDE